MYSSCFIGDVLTLANDDGDDYLCYCLPLWCFRLCGALSLAPSLHLGCAWHFGGGDDDNVCLHRLRAARWPTARVAPPRNSSLC
jgi:hypothetical protein